MPTPTEQKTTQAQILEYAEAIGWTLVSHEEAEQWRGLKENGLSSPLLDFSNDTGRNARAPLSLFFADTLDASQLKIDSAENKRKVLQDLFRTLLHELMTAKTRVHPIELLNRKESLV